jgi:RNA polymerase sigma factor (sigma-70 family)
MQPPPDPIVQAINGIVRQEWGRLLAVLINTVRDFQLAEDSLQDAVESALVHWARVGLPRSPAAWLLQTARRKAIDRIRRHRNFAKKSAEYALLLDLEQGPSSAAEDPGIPDERLRLMFTCCHPALEEKTRIALTLRTLGGLTTVEIARAFLDSEEAMAQRLVRARHKIKKAGIPYFVPDAEAWPERLSSVLGVIYLIFNEGYAATSGDTQIRAGLCDEAMRLARLLLELCPGEPEAMGLLALMLLHDARRLARVDAEGRMVPLEDQDRALSIAGCDQRGARRGAVDRGDGLAGDRRPLRPARPAAAQSGGAAQPCRRGVLCHVGRSRPGRARAAAAEPRALSAVPCDERGLSAPRRTPGRSRSRLRPRHRLVEPADRTGIFDAQTHRTGARRVGRGRHMTEGRSHWCCAPVHCDQLEGCLSRSAWRLPRPAWPRGGRGRLCPWRTRRGRPAR